MINLLQYWAIILAGSFFGILFMRFIIRRSLPVGKGRMLWLRFFAWMIPLVLVGSALAMFPLNAFLFFRFHEQYALEETAIIRIVTLSAPYWFGIGYCFWVQFRTPDNKRNIMVPAMNDSNREIP